MEYRSPMADIVSRAECIAEEKLFPVAMETDRSGLVPKVNLDILADAGFYGLSGPPDAGGLGADFATAAAVIEALAGGCLTTTFVWNQHLPAVLAVQNSPLAGSWLAPLCSGERRAGLALGGSLPGPARLRARETADGWRFTGTAAWLSGWDRIDVVNAAARDEADNIVWALLDARASETLTVEPVELLALDATATVRARFHDHPVPSDRILSVTPQNRWPAVNSAFVRLHAALALGVAGRCCRLLGPSPLDDELTACRTQLDSAAPSELPGRRAQASMVALRAAASLVTATGSTAIEPGHAQRLAREALFLLVFGSRPPIKAALLDQLGAAPADAPSLT
ncbi:acyl-CoA dehydrogenase family protein [Nocardia sp. NPDC051321]|uniref:acyl-CoA dehydrogenase family protein n=1 Tax=Nocardia sp. NPDC051321 TaxID=3364323 RepID=UPI0037B8D299